MPAAQTNAPDLDAPDIHPCRPARPAVPLWVLAAALTTLAFAASWARHHLFLSNTFDLGVYEQAAWKLSRLRAPELSMVGWNAFADHFAPVLVVFGALFRLAATPNWFFLAQAAAFGLGLVALGPALDALGLPARRKPAFLVAYAVNPLLWNAVLYDFHPTTLAIPLLVVGIRAAMLDQRRHLVLVTIGLLFLRDDLGLAVAAVALWNVKALTSPARRWRFALALLGISWMVAGGAIAGALGSDRHWEFHYGYVAGTPVEAVLQPLRSAARVVGGFLRADNLGLVVVGFLAPVAFLPLLRPGRLALALMPALPLVVSQGDQFHTPFFHYGAYVVPFLMAAAAGAAGTAPSAVAGLLRARSLAPLAALAFLLAGPLAPEGTLTQDRVEAGDARGAVALVGPDEQVVATGDLGAHLSQRDRIGLFPFPFVDAQPEFPLSEAARRTDPAAVEAVDVVLVSRRDRTAGLMGPFEESASRHGFVEVARFGDVSVFRRGAPS